MNQPALPYAGTEGASGSSASHDRATDEALSGAASQRQQKILDLLALRGERGATWRSIGQALSLHHGQVTGSLSSMHKVGKVARLQERVGRSSLYVLPEHVAGRPTSPQGRPTAPETDLRSPIGESIRTFLLEDFEGYAANRAYPAGVWILEGDLDVDLLAERIAEAIG